MADTTPSIYMNLPIPTVSVAPGPGWATNNDNCLTIIDAHDHSSGYGVQVTPAGLNINADLSIGANNLTTIKSARFEFQGSPLAGVADLGCIYASGDDLYYNDALGNQIQITMNGAVAGTPGSIANLVSPASASYVSANQTFVWQSAALTPANLDAGSIILRNILSNSKGLTLSPPAAMAANYTLTLPPLPLSTLPISVSSAGAMSAAQITTAQIADANITAAKVETNINLPGKAVKEAGQNVIVSNTNATNSLAIIRASFSDSAVLLAGEGATASFDGSGLATVVFTTALGDVPIITVQMLLISAEVSTVCLISDMATTGFKVQIRRRSDNVGINAPFNFIAIGQRA